MVVKKRKPTRKAAAKSAPIKMDKTAACGAGCCCAGCKKAKFAKALALVIVTVIITLFVSECWHKRRFRNMVRGQGGCAAGEFKKEWKGDREGFKRGHRGPDSADKK
ncbi:MAG: hypothetical protein LBO78_03955 [Rickettsiales bacterium]|jgi:hypothetical protein|nr:hypothetical protein [Rickettsiales bacterium]